VEGSNICCLSLHTISRSEDFLYSLLDVLSESSIFLSSGSSLNTVNNERENPSAVNEEGSSLNRRPDWVQEMLVSLNDRQRQLKFKKSLLKFKSLSAIDFTRNARFGHFIE